MFAKYTGRPEKFCSMHFGNEIGRYNTAEIMGHAEGKDREGGSRSKRRKRFLRLQRLIYFVHFLEMMRTMEYSELRLLFISE